MSTTPSDIWENILKGNVEKDDPLWKLYLDKAAVFDARMVDEWNKIVDVLLVYVALFISVLTSFIIQTFTQFQRNPADISNDLLVAIYNQMVAQSKNTSESIQPVDPKSYFNQSEADYDTAVFQNALLYTGLSLSIIVSVIALVAKLWLVNYSRQAFSVGSPYDRAMKRQEAYNGLLVWNIGGVINMLPVILLIALYLFWLYIFSSIYAAQHGIGHVIGSLLNLALMFIGISSLGGAFVPGCPFRSAFSGVIRLIFEILQTLSKWIHCGSRLSKILRWLWIGTLTLLWFASNVGVAYATLNSGSWFCLFFFPASVPIAYAAQQEVVHKPQKYKVSHLALWAFSFVSLSMILAVYYDCFPIFLPLYGIGLFAVVFACWMASKMSKSMADTGEIDAIAWLLITTPPQYPAIFFKKAAQMTCLDSIGVDYRPRLLESLMPLLTHFIVSHHAPERPNSDTSHPSSSNWSFVEDPDLENLEIYVACLARLSDFEDCEGNLWCLKEDARQHPKLEQPLIRKLVELANLRHGFQVGLRSAATRVLENYGLDAEGNSRAEKNPASIVWRISTVLRSSASLTRRLSGGLDKEEQAHPNFHRPVGLATGKRVEPPHWSGETGEPSACASDWRLQVC